ncbi:MAG: hypothetical protein DCC58_09620 [Chloroflexi bacterium]|nr:MAG: hypothetical protein DCC58_09620 [Chloroflexota bacterium]
MNALLATTPSAALRTPLQRTGSTVYATMLATLKRKTAYLINVVRAPLLPAVLFVTMYVAYDAAGRTTAGGVDVAGFLLVGIIGLLSWEASVWASGHSLEDERWEGTIASLFLTPASRAGVIAGYGLAGIVLALPSAFVVGLLALATNAQFQVASPGAVALGLLALLFASLATGFALASLFLLTRRANLMANLIQHPAAFLCGFFVPRDDLPSWLQPLSAMLPVSHALDAFRLAMLTGADVATVLKPAGAALAAALAYAVVGTLGLRRIEYAAKRSGQLDLF